MKNAEIAELKKLFQIYSDSTDEIRTFIISRVIEIQTDIAYGNLIVSSEINR